MKKKMESEMQGGVTWWFVGLGVLWDYGSHSRGPRNRDHSMLGSKLGDPSLSGNYCYYAFGCL